MNTASTEDSDSRSRKDELSHHKEREQKILQHVEEVLPVFRRVNTCSRVRHSMAEDINLFAGMQI